jgi:hypothetical protein
MLLVPELLHRWSLGEGQLANRALTRWRRKGCPPLVPYAARHVQRRFGLGDDDRHVERRERWLRRRRDVARRVVPGLVERRALPVRRVEPAPFVEPADHELVPVRESLDWHGTTWYRPWWPNQAAFVLPSFADAHIRINLAGRERDGIVARGDYDRACDDVERLLRTAISGRTGRSVVADIYRPRRTDPVASEGPQADLVVSFTEECDALEHPDLGVVGPLPVARTGAHTSEGFAWFAGGGIAPGGRGIRPLVDLPATLCAVAGAGAPGRLDGTPIPMANEPALR